MISLEKFCKVTDYIRYVEHLIEMSDPNCILNCVKRDGAKCWISLSFRAEIRNGAPRICEIEKM